MNKVTSNRYRIFRLEWSWCLVVTLFVTMFASNHLNAACLRHNGDGTMTDPNSGLIWQVCSMGQRWENGSCFGTVTKYPWKEAMWAANENKFLNKDDWILPTLDQLQGLLDSNCKQSNTTFWSSTSSDELNSWAVNLGEKKTIEVTKIYSFELRLVRASKIWDFNAYKEAVKFITDEYETGLAYQLVKNNIPDYRKFIQSHPNTVEASYAKDQIRKLLEPSFRNANRELKCEVGRKIESEQRDLGMSGLFDFEKCVKNRDFNTIVESRNPQQMYLAAAKYENSGERGQAKTIYLTIINKFSTNAIAVKAADRIASLTDVEAIESASRASQTASRNSANMLKQQHSEQCEKNRNACFSGCGVYKNYGQRSSCENGCALCAQ